MIRKIIFASIAFLLFACDQGDHIKIIDETADEYPTSEKLGIINHKAVSDKNAKIIGDDLSSVINALGRTESSITGEWILYINEKGKIDKVLIHHSGVEELSQKLSTKMKNWQFDVVTYKSEKSKYRINWNFTLNENDKNMFEVTSSSIALPILKDGTTFYTTVDIMPSPVNGVQGIQKLVKYPEIAKKTGIQGKVMIKALVNSNGDVVHTDIIKGIGSGCDEAAVDAVKKTKFNPGLKDGKPVNVQVIVPILFRLK